MMEVKMS